MPSIIQPFVDYTIPDRAYIYIDIHMVYSVLIVYFCSCPAMREAPKYAQY